MGEFKSIFSEQTPKLLKTDKGAELINKSTRQLFKEIDKDWFATEHDIKAQIVEQFNRTL